MLLWRPSGNLEVQHRLCMICVVGSFSSRERQQLGCVGQLKRAMQEQPLVSLGLHRRFKNDALTRKLPVQQLLCTMWARKSTTGARKATAGFLGLWRPRAIPAMACRHSMTFA